jgi:hypothetical protein
MTHLSKVRCWLKRTRESEWNGDSCTKREGHVREGELGEGVLNSCAN